MSPPARAQPANVDPVLVYLIDLTAKVATLAEHVAELDRHQVETKDDIGELRVEIAVLHREVKEQTVGALAVRAIRRAGAGLAAAFFLAGGIVSAEKLYELLRGVRDHIPLI